jgi:predicted oxidoreductase
MLLTEGLEFSRIIQGFWRLKDWNWSEKDLARFLDQLIDHGITTFDHADIYGDYECERIFGKAFDQSKRDKIQLVTKCGIKLVSDKYPERKISIYDYSYDHIIQSVENSLKNFKTDYLDLLLLHRPSPFFDPEEVVKAFEYLLHSGKVMFFGVSNFTPLQFDTLQSFWKRKLVTNQVEVSPLHLEHFDNGNMDFFLKNEIHPMIWSPMARGKVFYPETVKEKAVYQKIVQISDDLNCAPETVVYAWLLKHPVKMMPILGTHRWDRVEKALAALKLEMSLEQWFEIYIASKGEPLP